MANTIVNLTLLKVTEELNNLVGLYSGQPYQKVLTNQDLCQELIVYILNRIANRFISIPEEKQSLIDPNSLIFTSQELLKIENLFLQGLHHLNSRNPETQSIYIQKSISQYPFNGSG